MFSGPPGKPEKKINPLEKAMRLLSVRSYSERELMKKLRLAKIPAREATEAVAECRRRGYLNDELLAEDYAHALVNRGSGSRLVKLQLRKRGLPAEYVETALEKTAGLEPGAARRALEYKLRLLSRETDPRKKREKAFRFLVSRGFSLDVIRELFDEVDFGGAPEDFYGEY